MRMMHISVLIVILLLLNPFFPRGLDSSRRKRIRQGVGGREEGPGKGLG
jgi:hypothetical protein